MKKDEDERKEKKESYGHEKKNKRNRFDGKNERELQLLLPKMNKKKK